MLKNSKVVPNNREIINALRETEQKTLFNMIRHYFDAFRFSKIFKKNGGMQKFNEIKNELTNMRAWVVEERSKPNKIKDKEKIVNYDDNIKAKERQGELHLEAFKEMENALNGAKVEAEMILDLREIINNPRVLLEYDFKKEN